MYLTVTYLYLKNISNFYYSNKNKTNPITQEKDLPRPQKKTYAWHNHMERCAVMLPGKYK